MHKAVREYITNLSVNEIVAALLMNCLSSKSLKKVFKERIESWILLLFTIIDSLDRREIEMEINHGIVLLAINWEALIFLIRYVL